MSSPEYSSTARALAAPISPPATPSSEDGRPPFRRIASHASRRHRGSGAKTYQEQAIATAMYLRKTMIRTYNAMTLLQRILAITVLVVVNVLLILFFIYGEKFFEFLGPVAKNWRELRGGWAILWAMIFITAFPPLIGYSSLVTTCGFVFGFWKGWSIACTAATAGSLASFIASRTVLSKYVHSLVGEDKRFKALALTLKHDGLGTLTLIRWCPLPYSLSNGALSTIPTLSPLGFTVATFFSTPKLMIHVFIGTRLGSLAESGGKMDAGTKAINYASIAGGSILGAVLGYVIYRKTKARAAELEAEELRLAGGEGGEGAGLADPEDFEGTGMDDDDISLWDNDADVYHDGFSDDEPGSGQGYHDSVRQGGVKKSAGL